MELRISKTVAWFLVGIVLLSIIFGLVANDRRGASELVVVASESMIGELPKGEDIRPWKVVGHVKTTNNEPVEGAVVSLVAVTSRGESRTYANQSSTADGSFTFENVSRETGNLTTGPVHELKVSAFVRTQWHEPNRSGLHTWTVGAFKHQNLRVREIGFSLGYLPPLICFVILLALVAWFSIVDNIGKWYHFFPCVLALIATGSMVGVVGYSIKWIDDHIQPGKTASLGFLNFHQGSYVKDGTDDWLVSLTSPVPIVEPATVEAPKSEPTPKSETPGTQKPVAKPLATGLGVPLWVVFVSVLGSGLLTIVLVIGETLVPLPTDDSPASKEKVQRRFRAILEHQFFVLFSPLGGVILYQLMLAGGAAGQPVMVAITILGAGATLNGLLVRGVKYAEGWILKGSEGRPMAGETAGNAG